MPEPNREGISANLLLREIIDMTRHSSTAAICCDESTALYTTNIAVVNQLSQRFGDRCIAPLQADDIPHTILLDQIREILGYLIVRFDRPFDKDVFPSFDTGNQRVCVLVNADAGDYKVDVRICC